MCMYLWISLTTVEVFAYFFAEPLYALAADYVDNENVRSCQLIIRVPQVLEILQQQQNVLYHEIVINEGNVNNLAHSKGKRF